jgi:fructose-bisphosphate aldolase class 1
MLFTSPRAAETISGVIMQNEAIRERISRGTPLAEVLSGHGIKVDTGAKPLAGTPGGTITKGFDGLRDLRARAPGAGAGGWHGRGENLKRGQQAIYQPARCSSATSLGRYTDAIEATPAPPAVRRIAARGDD